MHCHQIRQLSQNRQLPRAAYCPCLSATQLNSFLQYKFPRAPKYNTALQLPLLGKRGVEFKFSFLIEFRHPILVLADHFHRFTEMSVVFSTTQGIEVHLNDDGSHQCSSRYDGAVVRKAIPLADGKQCLLLLDPDMSDKPVFENLLCIDQSERLIWKAKLSSIPDVFVDVDLISEGVVANTWSGSRVVLDPHTGRELKRAFVK
jgi:hypothetical protein